MNTKKLLLITFLILNVYTIQADNLTCMNFGIQFKNQINSLGGEKIYEGYIVTNNKDTLTGYIRMLSPIYNSIRVQFINEKNNVKEIFKSEELLSYAFKVDDCFLNIDTTIWVEYERHYVHQPSIPFGTNEVLLYKAQSGKFNLYHHFYEAPLNADEPIKVTLFIKTETGELINITRDNYKLVLCDLVNDSLMEKYIQNSKYEDVEYWVKYFNEKTVLEVEAD